jgi:hypothetical protein
MLITFKAYSLLGFQQSSLKDCVYSDRKNWLNNNLKNGKGRLEIILNIGSKGRFRFIKYYYANTSSYDGVE